VAGTTSTARSVGHAETSVPDTPDIQSARGWKAEIDPSIGYRLGEKERQLKDTMVNPTGGYVTPAIRDAILRSGQRELMSQAGEQTREGQYDVNRQNQAQKLALAGLTRGTVQDTAQQSASDTKGDVTYKDPMGRAMEVAKLGTGLSAGL
jgi:hypothetical protein